MASAPRSTGLHLALVAMALVSLSGASLLWLLRHAREAAQRASLERTLAAGPRVVVAPVGLRDRVHAGQALARLESPETDKALLAAEGDLILKRRNAQRARTLAPLGIVSRQALLPLVDLEDERLLRVSVYLGQDAAERVREGDPATLSLDERPGPPLAARVSRVSQALEPASRRMRVEIWLPNERLRIRPGSFIRRIRYRRVEPGLTDGKEVQIAGGLAGGEEVTLSLPPELRDGARVQPVPLSRTKALEIHLEGVGGSGRER